MTAFWIDPCIFGNVTAVKQFVDVGDRHLCVERASENEHGRCGLAEEMLIHQRHLLEFVDNLVQGCHVVKNGHDGGDLIEEILAVAEQRVQYKLFLKEKIGRRRLNTYTLEPRPLIAAARGFKPRRPCIVGFYS